MVDQLTPTGWAASGKWAGTREEGNRFTVEQEAELKRREIPIISTRTRTVRLKVPRARTASDIQCGRPQEDCFDVREVECPVVSSGWSGDTIITPGGDTHGLPPAKLL
jgi:hypothetical protein